MLKPGEPRTDATEAWVKDRIRVVLKHYGAFYFMPMQVYGRAGVSDFAVVYRGRILFVEAKRNDKAHLRAEQNRFGEDAVKAGAHFLCIHSRNLDVLNRWFLDTDKEMDNAV